MAPVTHAIDPKADAVITLRHASATFALWEENQEHECPITISSLFNNNTDELETTTELGNWFHGTELDEPEDEAIRFLVSSKHLRLASPWFERAMSDGTWSESSSQEADGLFHVGASDWDDKAFMILLDILHLKHRHVPRRVSLEMLAKIGVLIDYYECSEALEFFTDMWIEHIRIESEVPGDYCRDLVLWVWVTWFFDMGDFFKRATEVFIKQSDEELRTLDLPIPSRICMEMDSKRCQVIEFVVAQLHDSRERFGSNDYVCPVNENSSFDCGSIMMEALTEGMRNVGLTCPRPEVPFSTLSFIYLYSAVDDIASPVWSAVGGKKASQSQQHGCHLIDTIAGIVFGAMNSIVGLDLFDLDIGKFAEWNIRVDETTSERYE